MATTPAPRTAKPAAKPATTEKKDDGLDLAALAAGAVTVKAMPKASRQAGGTAALATLVTQSFTESKVFELPAVAVPAGKDPEKVAATLVAAVRRAATLADLGVSVRWENHGKGIVVSFAGKAKRVADKSAK